jgi:hypothetical protein
MTGKHNAAKMIDLMPHVKSYNTTLSELGLWWQKVALVGKINSLEIAATLLDDMDGTRRKLEELQHSLLDNLIHENLRKLNQELSANAQVAIDILIRNLFERTADVGFLATDDDLRAFLRAPENHTAIVKRLSEYTLKYSVYDEIIILAPDGQVMAHLDESNPITRSSDPLIAATINSDAPYVESFGHSDLQPQQHCSLIYSARITASNDPGSPLLGVLCLCFRFDDEMASIFSNLQKEDEIIAILDQKGRVIASNNHTGLPLSSDIEMVLGDQIKTTHHHGRLYFSKSAKTSGYQGFHGLDWQGHVMKPVATAFPERTETQAADKNLSTESNYFSEKLRHISHTATTIIDDLILVVLNGQIISAKRDAKEFMPVLDEIRNIGNKTKQVFDNSIKNLYGTVVASLLNDVQFHAFLAVDIMDRNLYERANDVRWWALTTKFRELMAQPQLDEADRATLTSILAYINSLYTVYTNLFLFNNRGEIIAVSNPEEARIVGAPLPLDGHFKAALNVRESQKYVVSPFESTTLYNDRHTYLYLTSILKPGADSAVGGIGIVFDSEPQFNAMLTDALPRDNSGKVVKGAFGIFTSSDGRVIASTNPEFSAGDELELDRQFFSLKSGERTSSISRFHGSCYAIGAAMSQGYREYKTTGDYRNDVVSLVFVPV